ncbi:regulatory protein GemA [uncultured Thiodictyon sp.]|uniref:regulatory protein GemA n=1 Tax=uncultured Thiodictyon sp. TaxID=1846217 RepID=UPI0025DE9B6B|nr:regulatory protein GemA [uncultured Thiodictyon sp.]
MAAKRQLSDRQRAYALLGIARRDLGWTEDQYREHLAAHGATIYKGRPSASTMDYAQIEAALAAMETAGWQRSGGSESSIIQRCHPARRAQWRKVCALWIALAAAGTVRDRSEGAMLKWCRRLVTEDRIEWASVRSLHLCIEGLKDWAAREGVSLEA